MKKIALIVGLYLFLKGLSSQVLPIIERKNATPDSIPYLTKIAFGSCNHQIFPQEMFLNIKDMNPDLFIFLGDNIYGDCSDSSCYIKKYSKQLRKQNFLSFAENIPFVGTWDDHEYGLNNSGVENKLKQFSQQLFLDFIGEPINSDRRKQEGIYTSYTYGRNDSIVKVILLDERYFRESPGENSKMLGDAQWTWLRNELDNSSAKINLICSGSQFLSDKKGYDSWTQYPSEMNRMKSLLKSSKANGVIFLSGDIHCCEMMKFESSDLNYPLYEFTASGMTHAHTAFKINSNSYKINNPTCKLNYGLITINWQSPITIKVELKDIQNFNHKEITIYLDDISVK